MSDQKNEAKKNTLVKRGLFVTIAVALAVAVISVVMNMILPADERADKTFDQNAWEEAVNESGNDSVPANAQRLPENEGKKDPKQESGMAAADATSSAKPAATATATAEAKTTAGEAVPSASADAAEGTAGENADEDVPEIDLAFMKPVEGNVTKAFSGDALIYSETMQDWRVHEGLDLAAENDTEVKAAADGKVEMVVNSGMLGAMVVIDHGNNVKTLYGNLSETPMVQEGQEVKMGDVIGKIGSTATLEIVETPHLHFEITVNEKTVDPTRYLPDMQSAEDAA